MARKTATQNVYTVKIYLSNAGTVDGIPFFMCA